MIGLEVRQREQTCEFRLTWGEGQHLAPVEIAISNSLTQRYQNWQQIYLKFYRTFRGRVVETGSFSDLEDWRSRLVKAEVELLTEFHQWLRHPDLDGIRGQIAQIARDISSAWSTGKPGQSPCIDIFLTCSPLELERLPWEAWEIGKELATTTTLRITRTPDTIRAQPMQKTRQDRNRVLVILGDDTGLDFQEDRAAVLSLAAVAEIRFIGWSPGQATGDLLAQMTAAIVDPAGWDLLLFAGHSNEAETLGGELSIAPGVRLSISEIAPQLTLAKQQGLQFALFNSCSGLSIAKSLIDLGFNQVAIMREPIHNKVAQEFLVQFLRHLAEYKDVHESLLAACHFLRLEKHLTYPSTALVPSLFCRPGVQLFRFRRFGFKAYLRQLLPTRRQTVALSVLMLLSLVLPVQGLLLEQRLWMQAIYRRFTQQVSTAPPPIALIQIDETSLQKAGIAEPNPIDRRYLASLVDRLSKLQADVIGIDYLLDRPAEQKTDDQTITRSLQLAAAEGTWLVLVQKQNENGEWSNLLPGMSLENPLSHWSLQGGGDLWGFEQYPRFLPAYVPLIDPEAAQPWPFSTLLALAQRVNQTAKPQPNLQSQMPLLSQLSDYFNQHGQNYTDLLPAEARLQSITALSYWIHQMWLHPLIDFSLAPQQVYQRIPAWQLLEGSAASQPLSQLKDQVVIIAAGGYEEIGLLPSEDNMALPTAVQHWRFWQRPHTASLEFITGGEVHAYMLYQLLTQRLVTPIPDLWIIGIAALLGRSAAIQLQKSSLSRRQTGLLMAGVHTLHGLVSLQLYISAAVLLPWLFPTLTIWIYTLPMLRKK